MGSEPDKQETIETLYNLHRHDIYRFARFTLGDASNAYDVVQEVFLRAIRSWDTFRHDSNAKTWLLSIARNLIYDSIRKRKQWEKFAVRYEPPYVPDATLRVETAMLLEESLTALKTTYRQVFVLRHIENLSIQEAAAVLGWSEGKVRTTDHRAVAKLREVLEETIKEVDT